MKHVWRVGEKQESAITLLNDRSRLASAEMTKEGRPGPDIWCVTSCHWDCVSCYVDCHVQCFCFCFL